MRFSKEHHVDPYLKRDLVNSFPLLCYTTLTTKRGEKIVVHCHLLQIALGDMTILSTEEISDKAKSEEGENKGASVTHFITLQIICVQLPSKYVNISFEYHCQF